MTSARCRDCFDRTRWPAIDGVRVGRRDGACVRPPPPPQNRHRIQLRRGCAPARRPPVRLRFVRDVRQQQRGDRRRGRRQPGGHPAGLRRDALPRPGRDEHRGVRGLPRDARRGEEHHLVAVRGTSSAPPGKHPALQTTARRVQRSTAESATVPERALRAHVRRRRA